MRLGGLGKNESIVFCLYGNDVEGNSGLEESERAHTDPADYTGYDEWLY